VLLVTVAATLPAAVAQLGPSGLVLPLLVALYTVGAWCPAKTSLPAGAASAVLVVGTPVLVHRSAWTTLNANALVAWFLLATVVGMAVRSQRRIVAQARKLGRPHPDTTRPPAAFPLVGSLSQHKARP
jgi:hypothetical protein